MSSHSEATPDVLLLLQDMLVAAVTKMTRLASDHDAFDLSDWSLSNVGFMDDQHASETLRMVLVDWKGHEPSPGKNARSRMKRAISQFQGGNSLVKQLKEAAFQSDSVQPYYQEWKTQCARYRLILQTWWDSFQGLPTEQQVYNLRRQLAATLSVNVPVFFATDIEVIMRGVYSFS